MAFLGLPGAAEAGSSGLLTALAVFGGSKGSNAALNIDEAEESKQDESRESQSIVNVVLGLPQELGPFDPTPEPGFGGDHGLIPNAFNCGGEFCKAESSLTNVLLAVPVPVVPIALAPKAARLLGTLRPLAEKTVSEAIKLRGGTGRVIRRAGELANKTLAEVADMAANGDKAARDVLKLVKQAARLGEKTKGRP